MFSHRQIAVSQPVVEQSTMHASFTRVLRRFARAAGTLGIAAALGAPGAATAQAYPNRPIVLTAPAASGGLTDLLARALAEDLGKRLNGTMIVENRIGAGGTVGMAAVARANPDGHSLILVFQGPATVAGSLYKNLSYDTMRDFVPIGMVGSFQNAVVVSSALPVKTVRELIELARQRPGSLNYGSAGNGSTSHLTGELFQRQAGVKMVHVPYRGEAPALSDLAAGQTAVVFSTLAAARPLAESGRVRIIGIATGSRSRFAPDVPTVSESGLSGFEVPGWYGLLAPARTPAPIVERLRQELAAALADATLRNRLFDIGIEPARMTVGEFTEFLQKDIQKWATVIREAGIEGN